MKDNIMGAYLDGILGYLRTIQAEEEENIKIAAAVLAEQIRQDKLVYIYGPGGHSNMSAMEVFFRAGSLMHMSAILDEGTLISGGALRSMAIERTPGYGTIVMQDNGIASGDVIIIANAYGMNTACVDAAITCKELGATVITLSSAKHALSTPLNHPARHPSKRNLHEIGNYHIDSKVDTGDALLSIDGIPQKMGAVSTFCNAYILNSLLMETGVILGESGMEVPIWKSGNAPGGDEWNNRFINHFKRKIRWL